MKLHQKILLVIPILGAFYMLWLLRDDNIFRNPIPVSCEAIIHIQPPMFNLYVMYHAGCVLVVILLKVL